jgi:hypothetical protein
MRPATVELRDRLRSSARAALQAAGIPFQEANGGAMFIVADVWILWPGVLRWRARHGERNKKNEGTGVPLLIKRVQRDQEAGTCNNRNFNQ